MASIKANVADPKEGTTSSVELDESASELLLGKRIGDEVDGEPLGFEGVKLRITGGSDSSGFPMRPDVSGGVKKRILLTKGVGLQTVKGDGFRKRKMIRGARITRDTVQVNMVKVGK